MLRHLTCDRILISEQSANFTASQSPTTGMRLGLVTVKKEIDEKSTLTRIPAREKRPFESGTFEENAFDVGYPKNICNLQQVDAVSSCTYIGSEVVVIFDSQVIY